MIRFAVDDQIIWEVFDQSLLSDLDWRCEALRYIEAAQAQRQREDAAVALAAARDGECMA